MLWPMLSGKSRLMKTTEVFGGYNHNLRIGEGEFYRMENMSSVAYPSLSPRKKRGVVLAQSDHRGMIAKDALCRIEGRNFLISDYAIDMDLQEGPKHLVSMGAYVIIFPDKKYINTADLQDRGRLEAEFVSGQPVSFSLCRADGSLYQVDAAQPGTPDDPADRMLWLDTSGEQAQLKQWSQGSGMWIGISATYVKISCPGIGNAFAEGDGVFLEGLSGRLTDGTSGEEMESCPELAALEGNAVIRKKEENYLVIPGILTGNRTVANPVRVTREVPDMDFVIERGNRLWGCRYGLNSRGKVVNEIYACKLGDFKNWNCFSGISTDSYAVSLGSDGPFTGAVTYGGYPLFWKENCVHKLYGDQPANFGIQTTGCRGVQQGSHRSLAVVGELLYYKARHGVCVYDGAMPIEISQALGQETYEAAAAGAYRGKYYISMQDGQGQGHLFVYDSGKKLWHREDGLRIGEFCSCGDALYAAEQGTGRLLNLTGGGTPEMEAVSWMVETGPLGLSLQEKKYVSRLVLRLSLAAEARLRISIAYDGSESWEHIGSLKGGSLNSFPFTLRPRRCDHFRLRIEGQGEARIYSMTQILSQGSDRL